jgi:hypothetical protein
VLITVGVDKQVFFYSLEDGQMVGKTQVEGEEPSSVRISADDRLIAISTISSLVHIISLEKMTKISSLTAGKRKTSDVIFTQDSKFVLVSSFDHLGGLIDIFSTFDFVSVIKIPVADQCFCMTLTENAIIIGLDSKFLVQANPLNETDFSIISSDSAYSIEYLRFLSSIIDNQHVAYSPEMNDRVICPAQVNVLHFYAYYNLTSHLAQALSDEAVILSSESTYDILQVSLKLGYIDSVTVILRHVIAKLQNNPYAACFVEHSIIELSQVAVPELADFYQTLLIKTQDQSLPRFATVTEGLVKSPCFEVIPKTLIPLTHSGQPVKFSQSAVRISTTLGSEESVSYLSSLIQAGNTDIFRSQFVKFLLEDKWQNVKWFAILMALFYLSYLVMLTLYTIQQDEWKMIVLFIQNAVLLTFELYQLLISHMHYFANIWNCLDLVRLGLFIVFASLNHSSSELLMVLTLLSWAKGIVHFRIFESTRYMVSLILMVFKDIFAFLTLLFYFMLTFTFAMLALHFPCGTDLTIMLEKIYLLTFGEFFIHEDNDSMLWLCFVVASVVNFLIMVNLLISIIGDTYDKLQAYKEVADRKEMAEVVLDIELLMVWNRKSNERKFIHIVEPDCRKKDVEQWQGRVRELQLKIDGIEEKMEMRHNSIERMFIEIKNEIGAVKKAVENRK